MATSTDAQGPEAPAPDGPAPGGPGFWNAQTIGTSGLIIALFGSCFVIFPVLAVLLTDLANRKQFAMEDIGLAFTVLTVSQGIVCLLYSLFAKMRANRRALFLAFLTCSLAAFGLSFASGKTVLLLIAVLGTGTGIVASIATVAIISFGRQAIRLQGLVTIAMRLVQLAVTAVVIGLIMPRFAAFGGFLFIAGFYLVATVVFPLVSADEFPTLQADGAPSRATGAAPVRAAIGVVGAVAVLAGLLILAAKGAVLPYVVPVAQAITGPGNAARQAMSVFVGGQLAGAVVVTLFTFGGRYLSVLTASTVLILASAFVCAISSSTAMLYIAVFSLAFALSVKDVFVLPMLMTIDPSFRAARQISTVFNFSEALGPFAASAFVAVEGVRGSLMSCTVLIVAGMAVVYGLEIRRARIGAKEQAPILDGARQ